VHHLKVPSSVLRQSTEALGVPLRLSSSIRYCGAFYGQMTGGEALLENITL